VVWKQVTDALVDAGYVRNDTLVGAPYDFRYAPFSRVGQEYQASLKELIERLVNQAGKPALLVSHSMGGLQVLYFLSQQTPAWKKAHVAEWIPIAAPWSGSNIEFSLFASGDNAGIPLLSSLSVRGEQRTYETNFWLLPVPRWRDASAIVTTPTRNYSAQDLVEFFPAIGYEVGLQIWDRIAKLPTNDLQAPGVPVRCLYSRGVDTPLTMHYPNGWNDPHPQKTMGDGDGTVYLESLKLCERWATSSSVAFRSRVFENIAHADMLKSDDVIAEILDATKVEHGKGAQSAIVI